MYLQSSFFVDDGQYANGDLDRNLRFDNIPGGSIKPFNRKMSLGPFE